MSCLYNTIIILIMMCFFVPECMLSYNETYTYKTVFLAIFFLTLSLLSCFCLTYLVAMCTWGGQMTG